MNGMVNLSQRDIILIAKQLIPLNAGLLTPFLMTESHIVLTPLTINLKITFILYHVNMTVLNCSSGLNLNGAQHKLLGKPTSAMIVVP